MKNFSCNCGAVVFFENSQCVSCGHALGWCPSCKAIRSIITDENGQHYCGVSGCGRAVKKCYNQEVEHVCNRYLLAEDEEALCDYCRFNDTIPDLSIEGNKEKWHRVEIAKRRVLCTLDMLEIPYGNSKSGFAVPLSFDFKQDAAQKRLLWFNVGKHEQVFTGHADGKVTINIREADDIEREKARVSFGEAHRTVIGHFRHEMGHYFWDVLIKEKLEQDFIGVFGDHNNPDYAAALESYYQDGPKPGWQSSFISAYASMHPWEDFAESFAAYLDMISVVDIAYHSLPVRPVSPIEASFKEISDEYIKLGLFLNEMNRAVGLLDLVPEVYTPAILVKIEFVHNLLRNVASRPV